MFLLRLQENKKREECLLYSQDSKLLLGFRLLTINHYSKTVFAVLAYSFTLLVQIFKTLLHYWKFELQRSQLWTLSWDQLHILSHNLKKILFLTFLKLFLSLYWFLLNGSKRKQASLNKREKNIILVLKNNPKFYVICSFLFFKWVSKVSASFIATHCSLSLWFRLTFFMIVKDH